MQGDFRIPGRTASSVAREVGQFMAREIQATKYPSQLLFPDTGMWSDYIQAVYRCLLKAGLKDMGISLEDYKKKSLFYKDWYSKVERKRIRKYRIN